MGGGDAGHGGDEAAVFLERRLHQLVGMCKDPMNPAQLKQALINLDAEFMSNPAVSSHGSTCVFAVVKLEEKSQPMTARVVVGNLGDSRAIILRANGSFDAMSVDHKPNDVEEKRRILAAGGSVEMDRVDGQLALSRCVVFRLVIHPAHGFHPSPRVVRMVS